MPKLKFEHSITLAYLIIGGIWILFSDKILLVFFRDSEVLTQMQTFKGWFYVLITGVLLYFFLKKHLIKIRKAEQKAIENDRLKTAFLQNISHEIRTPMNGIIGFAELLKNQDVPGEQKSGYVDVIIKSSEQLLKIVNQVLDISLIESGNTPVRESKIHLNNLIDEMYQAISGLITKEISLSIHKGLPKESCVIISDITKIKQVLQNLLNNAVKFTERGFIKFGYEVIENDIRFFVEDSGIGIEPSVHHSVFERFFQTEKGSEKLYDGVGLGLAICKGNVDLLNGKIWVESESGKGSKFFFTIPFNCNLC